VIRILAIGLLTAALALAVGGCAEAPPDGIQDRFRDEQVSPGEDPRRQPGPEGMVVEMRNLAFLPRNVEIRVGDSVTWYNADSVPHTVTGPGGLDSGELAQGESYEFTFDEAGQYEYGCSIHPTMQGLIVVR
jgi:plastocyanin